ncbi:hypothetical protein LY71_12176 [Geodermatophilus tzadiensis]|uniref:Uncharacterized protein n=1 Tax=Geodermatophilus tzadiensis TaxID=1137988 RepID=A0A2T0T168_9ACTN|nr:hypothetical protein [Geodermatophilus tzadiensis]PRY39406.1 hypothetical protein LY71_12176 [Geodermatophilus tzadiensis]
MLRAQFTYTASSRPGPFDTTAGWKVTAVSKDESLPDDVIRAAARNVGGFVPPALPELASKADVDALAHCLRLDPLDDAEAPACLSHIVAAGPDYSGRPNLFAHGLVVSPDGLSDGRGPVRPADLWDADLWLRPLGTRAAEESRPDGQLQTVRQRPLDDATVTSFTRAHPNQLGLVLAAVERFVVDQAPLVVVGDRSFASVATWVHLVGRLLLPASAWRLPFSTYERLRDARGAAGWPFAVVGVPAADAAAAAALPGRSFTVLRDDGQPTAAGLGRWALQDGTELAAGPWARLAEAVITSEFLPVVADQVEELAARVRSSTLDRPLWALGAAVLLDEDLAEFLGAAAADVVADHWPAGLDADDLFERLLESVGRHAPAGARAVDRVLRGAQSDSAAPMAQRARLRPLTEALASPAAFERLRHTLPEQLDVAPAARAALDAAIAGALAWVPDAPDPARALLAVASLMDGTAGPDRDAAVALARELLVPRLLDPDLDPGRLAWRPVPAWLWGELVPVLAATSQLEYGRELPGQNLSRATHEWLGPRSLPAGPLDATALRRIGPVEWERAAYRLFVRRADDLTPLERAAAFLATVHSAAVNEGAPIERWANSAAEDAYKRPPLDPATALVLMDVLPPTIPFAYALAAVLQRNPSPTAATRAAVARLGERETVPGTLKRLVERYAGAEPAAGVPATVELRAVPGWVPVAPPAVPGEVLVTAQTQLIPLVVAAQGSAAPRRVAWAPVAEALLRVDVRVLPMERLPRSTWDESMPWGEGWALLDAGQTDPRARTELAAHLLCRGARARLWPRDDWAAGWLTDAGEERHTRWAETVAGRLLATGDPRTDVTALVRVLTELAPRKPLTASPDSRRREDTWREDALTWARRVASVKRPSSKPRT